MFSASFVVGVPFVYAYDCEKSNPDIVERSVSIVQEQAAASEPRILSSANDLLMDVRVLRSLPTRCFLGASFTTGDIYGKNVA
jgi:hypothetical protein